jgi:hypothetical protein
MPGRFFCFWQPDFGAIRIFSFMRWGGPCRVFQRIEADIERGLSPYLNEDAALVDSCQIQATLKDFSVNFFIAGMEAIFAPPFTQAAFFSGIVT